MNKAFIVLSKTALAAAVLGIGFTVPAQSAQTGPQPAGMPANDAPQPIPGKDTVSTIPDKATPRADNEAGPQTPPEHSKVVPPVGSARAPNPKSPQTANEASDAHPERNQGATSGSTGVGVRRRSDDADRMNR